ncbi:MAG TPA: ABC transporter substrate-binding protein [Burkholderiales bacterium]|nr:ABC transporter substrate-binding protein [Burkholderiales bacterium]
MKSKAFKLWKSVAFTALAASAVAALVLPSVPARAQDKSPIIIGMLEDTSGGASFYSQLTAGSIKVAIEEINAKGGVLGRPLKLIEESDGNNPSQSPALVSRMIQNGAKVILLNSGSASAVASKKTLAEQKIPGLAPTNIDTRIGSAPDNEYSFMLPNPITDIGTIYAAAFQKMGVKTLGVISDDSPTIAGINGLLLPKIQAAGVTIVAQEKAPLDANDVTAQILRIKEKKPDAVLVCSLGGQLEVLFENTLYQQLRKTPRFSLASIGNQPATWKLAQPNALDGLVYAASIASNNPRSNALSKLLAAKQGAKFLGLTAYEAQGYDAVQLVKQAIEKAGQDDPTLIKTGLEHLSGYKPSFGSEKFTITFKADKHIGTDGLCGLVLMQFKGNKPGAPFKTYQAACD